MPDAEALTSPKHVGSIYNFVAKTDSCENCAQQAKAGLLATGQVPMTITLIHHAEDQNNNDIWHIDHRSVEAYLTRHLRWKATTVSVFPVAG